MLERVVALLFVVAVVGALVWVAVLVRRVNVTVVRRKEPQEPPEHLSDRDIDELLIEPDEGGPREEDDE